MSTVRVKSNNLPPVSAERLAELKSAGDEGIDFSEIPDLSENDEFWANARLIYPTRTSPVTLRIEEDMIDWFKGYAEQNGKAYQSVMKAVLRTFMAYHSNIKSQKER